MELHRSPFFWTLSLLLIFVANTALAKPGGGAGHSSSNLKDPNSVYGLCTNHEGNANADWMKRGLCKSISETVLNMEACSIGSKSTGGQGKVIDQIRNDQQTLKTMEQSCQGITEAARDRNKFANYFTQIIAALIIEESDWSNGSTSSMGAKGLGQLSQGSVKGYAKCDKGCANLGRTGNMKDDHANVTCTTAIAMFWVAHDKELGKGKGNGNGPTGSKGIARYFQPYREIDKTKRERMQKKVANWCQKNLHNSPENIGQLQVADAGSSSKTQ